MPIAGHEFPWLRHHPGRPRTAALGRWQGSAPRLHPPASPFRRHGSSRGGPAADRRVPGPRELASITESPQPSPSDAFTDIQAVRMRWSRSDELSAPWRMTWSSTPAASTSASSADRSGPSPMRWSSRSGNSASRAGMASMMRRGALVSDQSTHTDDRSALGSAAPSRDRRHRGVAPGGDRDDVALQTQSTAGAERGWTARRPRWTDRGRRDGTPSVPANGRRCAMSGEKYSENWS